MGQDDQLGDYSEKLGARRGRPNAGQQERGLRITGKLSLTPG